MTSDTNASAWDALPAAEMAKAWDEVVPQSAGRILDEALKNVARERRVAWAQIAMQMMTLLLVAGSVTAFVLLAKYYVDHDAPTQGATIVCTGLVALVGALLGRQAVAQRNATDPAQAGDNSTNTPDGQLEPPA